jgi:response regulator RpfG family c-di-GMP phosphodiesterase
MSEKILFVDDEPAVLDGYRRLLFREFTIATAVGGGDGLALIAEARQDPYAVVVSDLRMPEMDGIQFLSRVRVISPETVRIALTGYADMQSAIHAVNDGAIFRFLTKPCEKEVLAKGLTAGLLQHRLLVAERELLEQTLSATVKVLTDVLSLVNPAAFSRGERIRLYVQHIVGKLHLAGGWQFEVAAMLSQLGCVTLDTQTLEAVYAGRRLSAEEESRFHAHPAVAGELLVNIPRLEPVARMVARQDSAPPPQEGAALPSDGVTLGAQILKVVLGYDRWRSGGCDHQESLRRLRSMPEQFARVLVDALTDLHIEPEGMESKLSPIPELQCNMVLQDDLRTTHGTLLATAGQAVTYALITRLKNYWQRGEVCENVRVQLPRTSAASQTGGKAAGR